MSKTTVTAKVQTTSLSPVLMLAFELGQESWQLGFSTRLGQPVLRRKIKAGCTKGLLDQIASARQRLGVGKEATVVSCYEAGRAGFWLHRFLKAHGIENLLMASTLARTDPLVLVRSDPGCVRGVARS